MKVTPSHHNADASDLAQQADARVRMGSRRLRRLAIRSWTRRLATFGSSCDWTRSRRHQAFPASRTQEYLLTHLFFLPQHMFSSCFVRGRFTQFVAISLRV